MDCEPCPLTWRGTGEKYGPDFMGFHEIKRPPMKMISQRLPKRMGMSLGNRRLCLFDDKTSRATPNFETISVPWKASLHWVPGPIGRREDMRVPRWRPWTRIAKYGRLRVPIVCNRGSCPADEPPHESFGVSVVKWFCEVFPCDGDPPRCWLRRALHRVF